MLGTADIVWDVGCDHGYLSAALAMSSAAKTVIASDISPASAAKTLRLVSELGLSERVRVLNTDGLSGAAPEGEYKLVLCGMGGELIAELLMQGGDIAKDASLIVMQPMRGEEELRSFLTENGFGITDEAAVFEDGRYYQLIAAKYGSPNEIPDWFPNGYRRFGWVMCSEPDDNVSGLVNSFRAGCLKRLEKARAKGRTPEKLVCELEAVDRILEHMAACVPSCETTGEQNA